MLERGAIATLNHVLGQHAWARERLIPFAGHAVAFSAAPLPELRLRILPTGLLTPAPADESAALSVTLSPQSLPLILARDPGVLKQVRIEGSADLAETVQFLFRHLAWDVEEDLSKVFGDVLARRMSEGGRALFAWQREAGLRLAQNFAEYWSEEQRLLTPPRDVAQFARDVDSVRDDVARLEKRLELLERRR
jgi:ubiquinone biosynthesis protein UbiJ